ncbi:hypothetical protein FOA43_003455 [Brettanomyces nanus]|uniref:RRM domain-containing protein n=1 Tax=Eeniella nana TaxID=13502 RepID=A0A875S8S0_EENNA|nr:uncharacterized protein FOA43_003455 [Brettanomyces nanus]QPG76069.1 hypothetical protein FOA43_003455 [Brettanomyces nanus]
MPQITKLSKKQLKALKFKSKTSEKAASQLEEIEVKKKQAEEASLKPKKKRKTRRGHHGKGKNGSNSGSRFLLFVGNIPYDIGEKELREHFKAGKPDIVRVRKDKGIAFLEFLGENGHIQGRIDACLALHHSLLEKRKINVELTAGGGGNSVNRVDKIKTKNDKLMKERIDKIQKERAKQQKSNEKGDDEDEEATKAALEANNGIHPSRLAMIEKDN